MNQITLWMMLTVSLSAWANCTLYDSECEQMWAELGNGASLIETLRASWRRTLPVQSRISPETKQQLFRERSRLLEVNLPGYFDTVPVGVALTEIHTLVEEASRYLDNEPLLLVESSKLRIFSYLTGYGPCTPLSCGVRRNYIFLSRVLDLEISLEKALRKPLKLLAERYGGEKDRKSILLEYFNRHVHRPREEHTTKVLEAGRILDLSAREQLIVYAHKAQETQNDELLRSLRAAVVAILSHTPTEIDQWAHFGGKWGMLRATFSKDRELKCSVYLGTQALELIAAVKRGRK